MPQNFRFARGLRRAVLKEFEQQQKADAEVATNMRNCVLAHIKDLLQSLALFLESYQDGAQVDRVARLVFSTIAPSVSLDEWLNYRRLHTACEEKAVLLRQHLRKAQQSYDEVSPLGVMSRLFKDQNEKRVSDALKSARDKVADELSSVETELCRLEDEIKNKSTEFLRQAMRRESLEYLRNTSSPMADRVKTDLDEMTKAVRKLAIAHVDAQSTSLVRVQEHLSALAATYKDWQEQVVEA